MTLNLLSDVTTRCSSVRPCSDSSVSWSDVEDAAAEITGKEAALFMASGTMANLTATLTHCRPGDQIIIGSRAHTAHFERAGAARVAGVAFRMLSEDGASLPSEAMARAYVADSAQSAPTTLVWIEDPLMLAGGLTVPLQALAALADQAHELGMAVHMDGARVFNAAVAQGLEVHQITTHSDSVMFCLNKSLGAPLGAVLCGSSDFIRRAHANRQMLGGGAFHAPIGAFEALAAMRTYRSALERDHANALALADAVRRSEALDLVAPVETNMIFLRSRDPALSSNWIVEVLASAGLISWAVDRECVRLATHRGLSDNDIDLAVDAIARVGTSGSTVSD